MVFDIQNVSLTINEKNILSNINASFEENKFNSIIGPNGSGKSSLIKLLAKINKQTSGHILFLNEELAQIKRKDFAKKVSFFFQFNESNVDINVKQMVSYGRSAHKNLYKKFNSYDFKVIDEAIKYCDLNDLVDREISTLSGGERQRVYLAMTLAQEPQIIVLDEPTNHLDIKYQFQILSLVKNLMIERKLTVICILHDFNQVLKFSDNTLIIKDGQVYASGSTVNVVTSENIKDVFKIDSIIHNDDNGLHIDYIIKS